MGHLLMCNLSEWSEINGLQINSKKTQAIVFRAKNKIVGKINIVIKSQPLEFFDHIKILGVYFSYDMSWNKHINSHLIPKLASINGVVARSRYFLPRRTKILLYYSLFYSHIYYCLLVYGTAPSSTLQSITIQQKKIVRSIVNSPRLSHSAPIFHMLKILPFRYLYEYKLVRTLHVSNLHSNRYLVLSDLTYILEITHDIRNRQPYVVPFF